MGTQVGCVWERLVIKFPELLQGVGGSGMETQW